MTPRITCAICNKPVDRIEWGDNWNTGDRWLRAYCHGDTDNMTLRQEVLLERRNALEDFAEGVAFQDKRLPQVG